MKPPPNRRDGQPAAQQGLCRSCEWSRHGSQGSRSTQAPVFWVLRGSPAHGKLQFKLPCYFQSGGNSGKERQTHTKAARQAGLRGPSRVTAAALRRRLT